MTWDEINTRLDELKQKLAALTASATAMIQNLQGVVICVRELGGELDCKATACDVVRLS